MTVSQSSCFLFFFFTFFPLFFYDLDTFEEYWPCVLKNITQFDFVIYFPPALKNTTKVSKLCFFQWSCMMWEVDHKEGWEPENWFFWTVVLEKTLESPLDCKEIQPVHPKGNQSWVFIGRTDAEAEAPIVWPPDVKNRLTGKDPDAGKDWGQEKGATEDEMVGWHHLTYWTWVWAHSGR